MLSTALTQSQVLGLPLHLSPDYGTWLSDRLQQGLSTHVVTLNAEMAMQAQGDDRLATIIRQAELVVPDGSGVVFYLRLRGQRIERCPGIELAEEMLGYAVQQHCSVFFYGGQPDVAATAAQRWREQYPDLVMAGVADGYGDAAAQAALLDRLKQLQPKLIFVGLGVPRQEFWIQQHRSICPQATWVGVGGSFDIWAGCKVRAPRFLRNNHLEWTYRLYQEPWRWRRMLALPQFAWKALRGD
ncbi:MAG: WecB/TagA/CpsF family glycosyltransferase [Prochlorothrix sp.]